MSRAFVSEDAAAADAALGPERPVSPGPNPVTPHGHAMMQAEIERLHRLRGGLAEDDPGRATLDRDLRYWRARLDSAQVVPALEAPPPVVVFGCLVTIRRADGAELRYRIVGEDEADPAHGTLSWNAPLAVALTGAAPGETVEPGGGRAPVTVVALGV